MLLKVVSININIFGNLRTCETKECLSVACLRTKPFGRPKVFEKHDEWNITKSQQKSILWGSALNRCRKFPFMKTVLDLTCQEWVIRLCSQEHEAANEIIKFLMIFFWKNVIPIRSKFMKYGFVFTNNNHENAF